jgi:hypothetical protein
MKTETYRMIKFYIVVMPLCIDIALLIWVVGTFRYLYKNLLCPCVALYDKIFSSFSQYLGNCLTVSKYLARRKNKFEGIHNSVTFLTQSAS